MVSALWSRRGRKTRRSELKLEAGPVFEELGSRLLLSANVIISEFMASNDTTLLDEDGDSSDWIELFNGGDTAADLGGWHLTDDAAEPDKWTLPAGVSLAPGEFLVVFASNKDRTVAGSELHTNFRLDADGEYLALIDDGDHVLTEFAPEYPEQFTDFSYGFPVSQNETVFVEVGDVARYFVPTTGVLGDTWTGGAEPFDDSTWGVGVTGVGYEDIPLQAFNVGGTGLVGQTTLSVEVDGVEISPAPDVQVVRIAQNNPSSAFLSIREMEVFDTGGVNVGLVSHGGVASASSIWPTGIHPIAALNDGVTNVGGGAGIAHTGNPPLPEEWMQITLSQPADLTQVTIYNRGDCCGNQAHDIFLELYSDVAATQLIESFHVTNLGPDTFDIETVDVGVAAGGTATGTLASDRRYLFEIDAAGGTADNITVPKGLADVSVLEVGGELEIQLFNGTPISGQAFELFTADVINGNFSSVKLPDLSAFGLVVDDSTLLTDGMIRFEAAGGGGTVEGEGGGGAGALTDVIGFWDFEGDFEDGGDGAYHGSPSGDVTFAADVPAGIGSNLSASFDGIDDFIDLPINAVNPFDGTQDFTVAAWFKTTGNGDKSIILSSARGNVSSDHSMAFHTGPACCGQVWSSGALIVDNFFVSQVGVGNDQSVNVEDGSWQFGAMTYVASSSTYTILVGNPGGGFTTASRNFNPAIPNVAADTVRIGGSLNGTFPAPGDFNGQIDNLGIFRRALSESELELVRDGDLASFGLGAPSFRQLIATDIQTEMQGVSSSAYLRIPFDVTGAADVIGLTLDMQYDDGFVAYLNGVEIARRDAGAGAVGFDSLATTDREVSAVKEFVTIDVSGSAGALVEGENILAIHGLNVAVDDLDFLVSPRLSGVGAINVDSEAQRYFAVPTPGEVNDDGAAQPAEKVAFSVEGGTFTGSFQVELSTGTPNGVIHYTTDNSAPTAASPVYTGALTISTSTQLRAIALADGFAPSRVAGEAYVKLAANNTGFSSNLPVMVIDNFGGAGAIRSTMRDFHMTLFEPDEITGRTTITDEPTRSKRIGLRIRGASSAGFPKKQWRIETRNQDDSDDNLRLLGLPSESDWVLSAPYSDKSLIRNPFAFGLGQDLGLLAPNSRFVEVFYNENGGDVTSADYVGVYILTEDIKVGDNRVDITELDASDVSEPEITGGYLIRFENGAVSQRLPGWNTLELADPEDYTSAQAQWIANHVREFDNVLDGPNWLDPVTGYRRFIDVDSFVNLMVLNELVRDQDAYTRSNYLHKDRNDVMVQGPLWDYNLTTGVGCCHSNTSIQGWQYEAHPFTIGEHGWFPRLVQDPQFLLQLRDRWSELREDGGYLDKDELFNRIDVMTEPLGEAAVRNFQRWNILGNGSPGFPSPVSNTWEEQLDLMKNWLDQRIDWIDSQLLVPPGPVIEPEAGPIDSSTEITLTGITGQVFIETVLVTEDSPVSALVPVDNSLETGVGPHWNDLGFVPTGWTSGVSGVGYEDSVADYQNLVKTNVLTAWNAAETSLYTRFEFTLPGDFDAADFDQLMLRMKYDDGFIAYLNGVRVDSALAPATSTFNTLSTGNHPDSAAVAFEPFNITEHLGLLQPGANVLAIQGLNQSRTSSDMLILPELVLGELSTATTAPVYYTLDGSDPRNLDGTPGGILFENPFTVSESTLVSGRTFVSGQWSPLRQAGFVLPSELRITELMYNPTEATAAELLADPTLGNDDFEYIEIHNPSTTSTLGLGGYTFDDGISYTFPAGIQMAPGERVILAKNPTAYALRHGGGGAAVYGPYDGQLANDGEIVRLLDAGGGVIHDFEYDDGRKWPIEADGHGASLEIIDTEGDYSDADNWRASYEVGGTPGGVGVGAEVDVFLVPREVGSVGHVSSTLPVIDLTEIEGGETDDYWVREGFGNEYLVEVWVKSRDLEGDGEAILSGSLTLEFDPVVAQAIGFEFGSAFTESQVHAIDLIDGTVEMSAGTLATDLGDDEYVMLGRVLFASESAIDPVGQLFGAKDTGLDREAVPYAFEVVGLGGVPTNFEVKTIDVLSRAVIFDFDNDGAVNFGDVGFFLPALGEVVGGSEPPYAVWADFNNDGSVNEDDLDLLTDAFGKGFDEIVVPEGARTEGVVEGGGGPGVVDLLDVVGGVEV